MRGSLSKQSAQLIRAAGYLAEQRGLCARLLAVESSTGLPGSGVDMKGRKKDETTPKKSPWLYLWL
jgi:hypothetical protein